MRRKRQRLQVSTFPFIAVLLCAMGSLILLLLIMDRRAKRAALERAMLQAQQQKEEETRKKSDLQKQREAEWLRLQNELQDSLRSKKASLLRDLVRVQSQADEIAKQVADHRNPTASRQLAQKELDRLQQQRIGLEQQLRKEAAETQEDEKATRALAKQLSELENTVQTLKRVKADSNQTYSLVPYGGKRGERRAPVYVECIAGGIRLHPGKQEFIGLDFNAQKVRREFVDRLQQANQNRPADSKEKLYLFVLVRPSGLRSFYAVRTALIGLPVDLGYELIEDDWNLDFSGPEDVIPQTQLPQVASLPRTAKPGMGIPKGFQSPNSVFNQGENGTGTKPFPGNLGKGKQGIFPPGTSDLPGYPVQGKGFYPKAGEGKFPGDNPGQKPYPKGTNGIGSKEGNPAQKQIIGKYGEKPNGLGKYPLASKNGKPGDKQGNSKQGSKVKPNKEKMSLDTPPTQGDANGNGNFPVQANAGKRPPIPVSRLKGNRDWYIPVECKADGVYLPISRKSFDWQQLRTGTAQDNPLTRAVWLSIARRQKSVRRGEPPYRPILRFEVYPDGLQAYHTAYPLLEPLRVDMIRDNVQPVRSPLADYYRKYGRTRP